VPRFGSVREKANMPPQEAVRAIVIPVAKLNVVNRHGPAGGAAHAIEGETLPRRPVFTSRPRCSPRPREASVLVQGWRKYRLPSARAVPIGEGQSATGFSSEASTCPVHSDCQAASRARQVNGTLGVRHLCNPG
jgi:hypothetical protein